MCHNIDLSRLEDHPAQAVQLFKIMMRLEYALKACGYTRSQGKRVEVDWDRFVNQQLGQVFFERVMNSSKADTLINNPPSKQVLNEQGQVEFQKAAQVLNVHDLFVMVRRVRNNLFHGGKSGDADHDRNDALVSESIDVVLYALPLCPDVRSEFEGVY